MDLDENFAWHLLLSRGLQKTGIRIIIKKVCLRFNVQRSMFNVQ